MNKRIFFIIIFLFSHHLYAQNLVPNPSFETYDECPYDMTLYPKKKLIPHWYMPNKGTSDYFNSCTNLQVSVPANFIGNLWAFDGEAYAGIVLLEVHVEDTTDKKDLNYREYLQAELTQPLVKDQLYLVKMHYALATYSTYAVNRLGIYFSEEKIKNKRTYQHLKYVPQVGIAEDTVFTETDTWYEFVDTLKAAGNENYLTLGNFYPDKQTVFNPLDINSFNAPLQERIRENGIAYYYIDMVSVEPLFVMEPEE
ncbi:MAG: hypothetical protein V2I54_05390 [Bacteroidales bacterium]|jgi:hypothetical protein|nr:hypothetical protein [Bacteroidales bacterium]